MKLLLSVLIAAVVAIVVYVVLTTLVTFTDSGLIFGLLCAGLFLVLAFSDSGKLTGRGRWY